MMATDSGAARAAGRIAHALQPGCGACAIACVARRAWIRTCGKPATDRGCLQESVHIAERIREPEWKESTNTG